MKFEDILKGYTNKKVLITGGVGCIGSNLTKTLLKAKPERIVVIDDLSASYEWNLPKDPRITFIKGSVLDEEKMVKAFSFKPDFVFHRISFPMNLSSLTTPKGKSSVSCEIAYSKHRPIEKEGVVERAFDDLVKAKILKKNDKILVGTVLDIKCAYIIYDLNHRKNVNIIHSYSSSTSHCLAPSAMLWKPQM